MANKIQQLTDTLMTHAKSNGSSIKEIKEKSYHNALKELSDEIPKGLTEAVFLKSKRLAGIELMREKLQTVIDAKGWANEVRAVFPDATFQINARKRQILIEVE